MGAGRGRRKANDALTKGRAGGAGPGLRLYDARMMDPSQPTRAERIHGALLAAFPTAAVKVVDDSHRHAGHTGARPEGETHYSVRVVSPAFAGLNRLSRSRAVHAALEGEFGTGLHALSLRLLAPGEPGAD